MTEEMSEISGVVDSIVYRNENNGYTVMNVDEGDCLVCAVGMMPDIIVGDEVLLTGVVKYHPNYGERFSVASYERSAPTSSVAIYKYLASRNVKGIGAKTALKIVEEFGDETLDVIENDPQRLLSVKGITKEKAESLSQQVQQAFGYQKLMLFMLKYEFSAAESVRVWNILGTQAMKLIEQNPYILCENELNFSFERIDRFAGLLAGNYHSEYRVRAAIVHILSHNTFNGHTCLPRKKIAQTSAAFTDCTQEEADKLIGRMISEESLFSYSRADRQTEYISLPLYYSAETYSAARFRMLLRFPPQVIENVDERIKKIERSEGIEYAQMQKTAIRTAVTKGILILTGGPGTGKTTTLNAIIRLLQENGERVLLAAPTGRAAQRMSEVTGCEAKTIHRLLEVEWITDDRQMFRINEQNPLPCDALILDETSMIDTLLLESIMRALPLGCRLILVGDNDQLPSVGAGNVLGDLVSSGTIPTVALNEVFRQSMESDIIANAHRINRGEQPKLGGGKRDFFFLQCESPSEVNSTIRDLCCERLPKTYGFSAMNSIQVLSPTKIGRCGTAELNRTLQDRINPQSEDKAELTINERILRAGDKVMQVKNNYNIEWERDDGTLGKGIFNGDLGVLTDIDAYARSCTVVFDDKTAKYTFDNISELELAYCTTVHKSQGNEYDAVIISMWGIPAPLKYRNLLYTAVTRAKKLLIIVGNTKELGEMIGNNKRSQRYTLLRDLLAQDE